MFKTLFRYYSCIRSAYSCRHLDLTSRISNESRYLCNFAHHDNASTLIAPRAIDESEKRNLQSAEGVNSAVDMPARHRRPTQPPQSLTEAVYRSEFLRNMVDLGVNLFKIQKDRPLDFDFIMSLRSWDPEPAERIKFLLELGVRKDFLANIITENPWILKENLEDMQVRVNYLLSKKFFAQDIAKMVEGCPKLLTMKTLDIDSRLGYLQHGYKLDGNQVRYLASSNPWIVSLPRDKLTGTLDVLKDVLSFNPTELKALILNHTEIWKIHPFDLQRTAEFLHYELKMSHKKMVQFGHLLIKNRLGMKYRHDFMKFMNRADFDVKKPNYHSYDILWQGTTEDFCKKLHTNVDALELFAKSV